MKVLLQTYAFWPVWGGVQKSVETLYCTLSRDKRFRVKLVTSNYVVLSSTEKHVIHPSEQYKSIRIKRFYFILLSYVMGGIQGLNAIYTYLHYYASIVKYFFYFFVFRPNIVHLHFINVDSIFTVKVKRIFNFKLITTCQGNDILLWDKFNDTRKQYTRDVLFASDHVTAVSDEIASRVRRILAGTSIPIQVIRNGIDQDNIKMNAIPSSPHEQPYFLFVGHLTEKKNPLSVLKAFDEIRATFQRSSLVLIGTGPMKKELDRFIGDRKLSGSVKLLGQIPQENVWGWISKAAALILPSAYGEGTPNVILEAMALGTPVIGSAIGGIREMITDGENGLLFEPDNLDQLIDCMKRAVKETSLKDRLSRNGLMTIRKRYDNKMIMKKYLDLYHEILHTP